MTETLAYCTAKLCQNHYDIEMFEWHELILLAHCHLAFY